MKYFKYVYEDPTGGGDDIVLIVPTWVRPDEDITVWLGDDDTGDEITFTMNPDLVAEYSRDDDLGVG